MKYAFIQNGVVVDCVQVHPSTIFRPEYSAQFVPGPDSLQVGWLFDGELFSPPPDPVPTVPVSVTMRQARLALLAAGLLDTADAVIAGIPGDVGRAARIEWEYAQEVRRDNALLQQVQALAGFSDQDVDSLFLSAAAL